MMITQFALAAQGLTASERTSTAGIVTLQGMLSIFAVLAILWGATELMHRILHKDKKPVAKQANDGAKASKASQTKESAAVPNEQDAAVAAAIAATLAAYEDNGAIVAAITAAITAARAEEGDTGAFRVVSFKRANPVRRR